MKRQRGISLISLMVGLIVSLTATVGLLSVYRNSLKVTAAASQGTTSDSQLASLLLRTGESMGDAGYGIASAAFGTHIVPISNASMTGSVVTGTTTGNTLTGTTATAGTTVNAIVWAMSTSGTTQCAGFYAPTGGGLVYLSPINCSDATSWNTAGQWNTTPVAAPGYNAVTSTPTTTAYNPITFTVAAQSCAPYGISSTLAAYAVTISTVNSINTAVTSLQCLMNFQ
jgi:hypothetical protein